MKELRVLKKGKYSYLYEGKYVPFSLLKDLSECRVDKKVLSQRLTAFFHGMGKYNSIEECVTTPQKGNYNTAIASTLGDFDELYRLWG